MKMTKVMKIAAVTAVLALGGLAANAQQPGNHGQTTPGMGQGGMGQGMGGGMMGQGGMGMGRGSGMMQGGMMGGNCPMMGMMMGGDGETHAAGRIAFLKAELGITKAQESAFDAYAKTLQGNMKNMHEMRQSMMGAKPTASPTSHLDTRVKMMESRLASLKAVKPALDKLYATLSADQKKKADKLLTGMGCMM